MASKIQSFKLNNGREMPSVGYGTWMAKDDELEKAIEAALEIGYRHIDTAYTYENEKVIGRVLKRWFDAGKLKREDIFLVTKLPPTGNRPEGVPKFLKRSLESLQVDYVDLYLIHVPFGFKDVEGTLQPKKEDGTTDLDLTTDHVAMWKAMEQQVDAGLTKAIGISNFNKAQVERILNNSRIKPSALQIELHVYLQQNELVHLCRQNDIQVTAYSPLGSPGIVAFYAKHGAKAEMPDILGNPVVKAIAQKHSKSAAQIVLRYHIQRQIVVIPKSTNPERLRQNLDIFGFQLDEDDIKQLKSLDVGIRLLSFKMLKGVEEHPEFPF
ncbi:hypothetical protein WA026_007811 [Henosepilachna vigintioctopunctata]|uniref:NADP-dependent oxidoreductase domain-containing protein n=1 Tax=Henosepilachna vigintioctopunctata TaxID=420089 RepID=A0AAW1U421_9CUCU